MHRNSITSEMIRFILLLMVAVIVAPASAQGWRDELVATALGHANDAAHPNRSHYKFGESGAAPKSSIPYDVTHKDPWTYWQGGYAGCPEGDCGSNDWPGHFACAKDCVSWGLGSCLDVEHFDCSGFVLHVIKGVVPELIDGSGIDKDSHSVASFHQFAQSKNWWHSRGNEARVVPDSVSSYRWDGWETMQKGDWVIFRGCSGTVGPIQHIGFFVGTDDAYPFIAGSGTDLRRYRVVLCDGNTACDIIDWGYLIDGKPHAPGVHVATLAEYFCGTDRPYKHVYPAGFVQPPVCTASITARKFDGTTLLVGFPITLQMPDGSTRQPDSNDANGAKFLGLETGKRYVAKEGGIHNADGTISWNDKRYKPKSPIEVPVDIPPASAGGCNNFDVEFNNVCVGDILVGKFEDSNMNGVQDPGEPPISVPWPIRITGPEYDRTVTTYNVDGCTDERGDPVPRGYYRFINLEPGDYKVTEESSWVKDTFDCATCGGATKYCDWWTEVGGKKWLFTSVKRDQDQPQNDACALSGDAPSTSVQVACDNHVVLFGNVCLTSLSVTKFEDPNMNAQQDGTEQPMAGWPVKLIGRRVNGQWICPQQGLTTAGSGSPLRFDKLAPGKYWVSEQGSSPAGDAITWVKVDTVCQDTVLYSDWRATWKPNGYVEAKRWQSTRPRFEATCAPDPACGAQATGPTQCVDLLCDPASVSFGNVCLGTMSAFKFHDKNMNGRYEPDGEPFTDLDGNGTCTLAEPLTDLNCNGKWDHQEFFRDLNANGKWDPVEPFSDLDGDKLWDEPECPIGGWPFCLTGNALGGCGGLTDICLGDDGSIRTGPDGVAIFADLPPSDPAGYTISENIAGINDWTLVNMGARSAWRTTFGPLTPSCPSPGCPVTRWEATEPCDAAIPPQKTAIPVYCGDTPALNFGNVCLTTVDGDKVIYDDGMPGQGTPTPGAGWEICLAGKDLAGRDVVPSDLNLNPILGVAAPPISLPCKSPVWHSVFCDANGHFRFTDLPPGHYELMERPDPKYRLSVDKPLLCGFDLECCPETTELTNISKSLAWKIYQVYPGNSEGNDAHDFGYSGSAGDAITAVPGVLQIVPGNNWEYFKQATQLCRESPGKNTVLIKETPTLSQCSDVFPAVKIRQQGTPNVRLWWPLMYEPPQTTWKLQLTYGTKTPVKFPGENVAGYYHVDEWKWVVDTDLPHMSLLLDLFHETPFGLDEVPLISDERLFGELKQRLDDVEAFVSVGDTANAGLALGEFEMTVQDACIATSPMYPNPTGPGTGIAQTQENPACCKLLVDAGYVGSKLNIFQPSK